MTEAQLLDKDAFNRLVLEENLKTWEAGGYTYTGRKGPDGWEIYRTYGPRWMRLYQHAHTWTNTNAAGGAIIVDITCASPYCAILVSMYASQTTTGTHTLRCLKQNEDGASTGTLANAALAATGNWSLPSIGSTAGTTGNYAQTKDMMLVPGERYRIFEQEASGADNDTVTVNLVFLLPIDATEDVITYSYAASTNAADVVQGANTIGAANAWQAVLVPWP